MLDRRERSGELIEGILTAQEGHQSSIWTALPGIIQSFDATKKTCVVQPALKALVSQSDGTEEWVTLPLLVDCPVQFPGAGGFTLTFPIQLGDECLVVFAARCIDAWWQSGGIQQQAEMRMHDLSDGYCIPGISSLPRVTPTISTTETHLRNSDGTRKVRITNTDVELIAGTGSVKVTDNRIDITGVLWINGERYIDHKHTGVTPGGSLTGPKS